jgi:hypothetical protein
MGMIATLREWRPGDLERLSNPDQAEELFARGEPSTLSLEKAWHGLDALMTAAGDAPELGFIMVGGVEVGEAGSYGAARLLDAGFVRRLDAALQAINPDQLWGGFDAAQFEADGIYPGIWDEPEADLREEYVGYYEELRGFVSRVAAAGGQVAVVIQ